MAKQRLDLLLLERGLCQSREQARGLILAGKVKVGGKVVDKAGQAVSQDAALEVATPEHGYVSRGGLKLEKALREFAIDLGGKTLLDVGSSTGGFTDCALQHGASQVVALDVGTGQLDWKLRNDPRVIVMERTNIRHVTRGCLPFVPNVVSIDVSFISLRLVLPVVSALLDDGGEVIALIKPQFEAGREQVSRGRGVIRASDVHVDTVVGVIASAGDVGLTLRGLTWSPIRGPEGNIEFVAWLQKDPARVPLPDLPEQVSGVVLGAHKEFAGEK